MIEGDLTRRKREDTSLREAISNRKMVADWVSFESIQINLLTFAIEMVMGIFKEDDECEW